MLEDKKQFKVGDNVFLKPELHYSYNYRFGVVMLVAHDCVYVTWDHCAIKGCFRSHMFSTLTLSSMVDIVTEDEATLLRLEYPFRRYE